VPPKELVATARALCAGGRALSRAGRGRSSGGSDPRLPDSGSDYRESAWWDRPATAGRAAAGKRAAGAKVRPARATRRPADLAGGEGGPRPPRVHRRFGGT